MDRHADSAVAADAGVARPALKRRKRDVDRRASKGRKVSYELHPKLQNFMFPTPVAEPVALHELFANVFGSAPAGGKDRERAPQIVTVGF